MTTPENDYDPKDALESWSINENNHRTWNTLAASFLNLATLAGPAL
jgi:hypothetical protein